MYWSYLCLLSRSYLMHEPSLSYQTGNPFIKRLTSSRILLLIIFSELNRHSTEVPTFPFLSLSWDVTARHKDSLPIFYLFGSLEHMLSLNTCHLQIQFPSHCSGLSMVESFLSDFGGVSLTTYRSLVCTGHISVFFLGAISCMFQRMNR